MSPERIGNIKNVIYYLITVLFLFKLCPGSNQGCGSAWIHIIFGSFIRIRIWVKSLIRLRIKLKNSEA